MDDKIAISKFKATCLELLEKVHQTGNSLTITKKGKPIALVLPARPEPHKQDTFGCMANELEIVDDIVQTPGTDSWEVFSE